MSTLITGAAGFVGANLLARLVSTGHDNVHILIRPHTDTWRINRILNNVTVHTGDISDALSVNKLVTSIKPRVIFHLAATTSGAHPRYEDSPEQLFSVNATGTLNLLTACASNQPCLFINTGSSSEYGKKSTPMRESMDPNPCTPYGISKMMSTLMYCEGSDESEFSALLSNVSSYSFGRKGELLLKNASGDTTMIFQ